MTDTELLYNVIRNQAMLIDELIARIQKPGSLTDGPLWVEAVLTQEGGVWLPFETNTFSTVHAVRFLTSPKGKLLVWDAKNGWRT